LSRDYFDPFNTDVPTCTDVALGKDNNDKIPIDAACSGWHDFVV